MRRATGCVNVIVVLAVLGCSGCYESPFPIDSVPQANVEPALIGVWRCLPFDEAATQPAATLTIARGAERRYAVTLQEDGDPAERYEAYGSSTTGVLPREVRFVRLAVSAFDVDLRLEFVNDVPSRVGAVTRTRSSSLPT